MKTKTVKRWGVGLGCLAVILVFVLSGVISWLATCGVIKLITLCFGWKFSWLGATGIWLIFWLVNAAISKCK